MIIIKVLYLTYSPSPYRVDFFEKLGKNVDLTVCYEITGVEDKKINMRNLSWYGKSSNNYSAIYLNSKRIIKKRISIDLIKIIKNNEFDIIVIGGYSSLTAMITIIYLKIKGIKYILNTDGGFPKSDESKLKCYIKRKFISSADYYLSTGNNANNYLMYYGANKNSIYQYPFTSLTEEEILKSLISKKEKIEIRKKLKIANKITILTVGRFLKCKGFDTVIKSAKGLDEIQVMIIGGKPTEEYKNLVNELQLSNISFVDFMPKIKLYDYMQAADIFVLATRGDTWGLVINEALSMGLPVITTNKCGAGIDLIKNDYNGYIFESENYKELNRRINNMINNKEKLKIMSQNALDSIKKYTIENEVKAHIDAFNDILNKEKNRN